MPSAAPPPSGPNWASTQPRSNCDQSNAQVSSSLWCSLHVGVCGIVARHYASCFVRRRPPRPSCRNSHHPSRQPGTRPRRDSPQKASAKSGGLPAAGTAMRKMGGHRALHNAALQLGAYSCARTADRARGRSALDLSIRIGLQWRHAPVYHLFNLRCCMPA
ncbi:hypothetical protein BJY00DRAFT_60078 [Aspergillus carlsbadensis]|nr:hypothetical protein BJY00DRAFT_60078 [Aspergillus carlsbadensis]